MRFTTKEDALEWVRTTRQTAAPLRDELSRKIAVGHCYHEGIHWLQEIQVQPGRYGYRRLDANYHPEADHLRVTANQITYRVQKVAASTYPDRIAVEARTPDRDFSISTLAAAKASQDAVNSQIDRGGLLAAARNANFARCVAGSWGLGIALTGFKSVVEDVETDDYSLRFFDFDPLKLTLDPFIESRNLIDHDVVVYSDAWTHHKITRELGIAFTPKQLEALQEVGTLTPFEQDLANLSGGRLMAHYRRHSKTKGAMVHQIHAKSPGSSRFDRMWVLVELPEGPVAPTGLGEGMETPFGGCGLPFVLLHAHQRLRSPWGISDVMMMRDDQNIVNLIKTIETRMIQKSAGWQWLLDKRSVPKGTTDDQVKSMFSNAISGVVAYEGRTRNEGIQPPTLVQYPQPPQYLPETLRWHADQIREKTHRAEATFGQTKSHVPDASFQRALDEADQVGGTRVREDIQSYEVLGNTLLGTIAKQCAADVPSMLATLKAAGLTGDDLKILSELDPVRPIVTIAIRESSVRFRSHDARRQDLQIALQAQAIDPMRYRAEMARTLDSPIVHMDGLMTEAASDAVQAILLGKPWEPMPLGEYSVVFMDAFRAATFDRRATPETQQLLRQAMADQLAMDARERSMADPSLDIQRQQAEEQQMAQEAEMVDAQVEAQPPAPSSLAELLEAMQTGGSSAATSTTSLPYAEATV